MTIDRATLDRLDAIYEAEGSVPEGLNAYAFTQEILPLLGSTDGPLRERKVLGVLYTWIAHRELTDEQLKAFAETLIDEDHLFLGIGNPLSDTVYMRAFAVFMLTPFLQAHLDQAFLSPEDLSTLQSAVVRYLNEEVDLRGYISPETWWGHGVAHAADAVRDLASCEEFGAEALNQLLVASTQAIVTDRSVFVHEEDTRIATAIIAILKRNVLAEDQLDTWRESMIPDARWTGELPGVHFRYVNARNLLRCLIHQGRAAELDGGILRKIEETHAALPER